MGMPMIDGDISTVDSEELTRIKDKNKNLLYARAVLANHMQTYESNGEQNKPEDKLLTTNFEVKVENRKVEGLIAYSTDLQIFKLKVNSGTD